MLQREFLKLKHSLIFPVFLVILIWIIYLFGWGLNLDLYQYGVFPRRIKGLWGILTMPLIHADLKHIMANTIPFFVLTWGLFYFYRQIAYRVFFLCYLTTGALVWLAALSSGYHVGASGLIYAFASFLFFSGIFRSYYRLIAISLVVVFLYGGLFWGIFPTLRSNISWEGHLFGAISGFIYAKVFRFAGPQKPKSIINDDDESDIPEEIWNADEFKG